MKDEADNAHAEKVEAIQNREQRTSSCKWNICLETLDDADVSTVRIEECMYFMHRSNCEC